MASTDNSIGNSGSKCANTAATDVRVHFTAQTAFSHLCDQFQDVVPMSSHRGWHISRKKRSQNCLAFAFESTSTWKLKSPQRRNWQNVTVNSSDNAENSEKNLSTVKPRRKTCNQRKKKKTKKKYSLISRNVKPFTCDNRKRNPQVN